MKVAALLVFSIVALFSDAKTLSIDNGDTGDSQLSDEQYSYPGFYGKLMINEDESAGHYRIKRESRNRKAKEKAKKLTKAEKVLKIHGTTFKVKGMKKMTLKTKENGLDKFHVIVGNTKLKVKLDPHKKNQNVDKIKIKPTDKGTEIKVDKDFHLIIKPRKGHGHTVTVDPHGMIHVRAKKIGDHSHEGEKKKTVIPIPDHEEQDEMENESDAPPVEHDEDMEEDPAGHLDHNEDEQPAEQPHEGIPPEDEQDMEHLENEQQEIHAEGTPEDMEPHDENDNNAEENQ